MLDSVGCLDIPETLIRFDLIYEMSNYTIYEMSNDTIYEMSNDTINEMYFLRKEDILLIFFKYSNIFYIFS